MITAARPAPAVDPLNDWEGTSLTCHLRSWPASPPDTDAFSAGYAGGLMVKAADEIDRLTAEVKNTAELTYGDGYRRGLARGRQYGRDRFRPGQPEGESIDDRIKARIADSTIGQDERDALQALAQRRAGIHAELAEARSAFENDPTDSGWAWLCELKARLETSTDGKVLG